MANYYLILFTTDFYRQPSYLVDPHCHHKKFYSTDPIMPKDKTALTMTHHQGILT